jgi:hypothetical protein
MTFLDKLESRFGRFAIPALLKFVAGLQLLTFCIFVMQSEEARVAYFDFLRLDSARVFQGQIWRLITYIFVPSSLNFLFALIGAMFMSWLGKGLEAAWGAFRLNVYFIGGMISVALGSLLFGFDESSLYLFHGLLFAFAMIYPNEEILMFFILPMKIKWIAWMDVAMLVLMVMSSPASIIPITFALANFLVTFGPGLVRDRIHFAKVAQRRSTFTEAAEAAFFHQCTVCKKTEVDDPKLDFRVNEAGDEICSACRTHSNT